MRKIRTFQIVLMLILLTAFIAFVVIYALLGEPISTVNASVSDEPSMATSLPDVPTVSDTLPATSDTLPTGEQLEKNTSSEREVPEVLPQHFSEQEISDLDAMIATYGEGVSVYFEDVNSGNVYMYNEDEKYYIASVIKAPYCMYLYDLASQGKIDLQQKFTFEEKHKQEGTGKLKEMETPIDLTIRELISYAIIDSDNTAMKILLNTYNYIDYQKYAISLGIKYPDDVKYVVNGDIGAIDAGVYLGALFDFIETNEYGPELKKDMLATRNAMITSKYPIARKYGWADLSFHDMGIVYAPNPYLIAVLTNHDEGKQEDYKLFRAIANYIEKLQKSKYDEIG